MGEGKATGHVRHVEPEPRESRSGRSHLAALHLISYAKKWGYDGIKVVNLFAYISTDPKGLRDQVDAVGPENDKYVLNAVHRSEKVIVALGKKHLRTFESTKCSNCSHL